MFVAMNLGIDGVDLPKYEDAVFNSRFTSNLSRPTVDNGMKNFDMLSRCVHLKGDEFTVFEPVFNKAKNLGDNFTANSSETEHTEVIYLDGEQTQELQVLVSGRVGLRLPPLWDGDMLEYRLDPVEWNPQRLAIVRIGNASFENNPNVRTALCSSDTAMMDSLRCLAVFPGEKDNELTFNLFEPNTDHLSYGPGRNANFTMHVTAIALFLKMNVADTKNSRFYMDMALDLRYRPSGRYAANYISTLLVYYYKPDENKKQALLKVRKQAKEKKSSTDISKTALIIMYAVVFICFALLSTFHWICGTMVRYYHFPQKINSSESMYALNF